MTDHLKASIDQIFPPEPPDDPAPEPVPPADDALLTYNQRWSDIPSVLRGLALDHAVILSGLELYARTPDQTMEEALRHIIIALADQVRNRDAWIAREVQLSSVEPGVVPDIARSYCRTCGDPIVYLGTNRWAHTTPGHNHRPIDERGIP